MYAAFASSAGWPVLAQGGVQRNLLDPGELPDYVLGDDAAPVTIVEYASMTCGPCALFHNETFGALKEQYIDRSKVRFVFREYPLDAVATAAAMLARSVPSEKFFEVIGAMFANRQTWAQRTNAYQALLDFSKQIGFTQKAFEECLTDQSLLNAINAGRIRARNDFGVTSTPTFFVNGARTVGALSFQEISALIEAET